MSEHTRPRLLRHMVPSGAPRGCHPSLLWPSTNVNKLHADSDSKAHPGPSNVNMAFDDKASVDSSSSAGSRGRATTWSSTSNHLHGTGGTVGHPGNIPIVHHVPRPTHCRGLSSDKTYDQALFDILKVDAESFAKQITLIELDYFKAIQPEEFLSFKWNGKEKVKHAPNIVTSTKWFNRINFWVQREILNVLHVSKRSEVLAHFIKITKKLIELNNLYSAMAIVSALQVQCIYRLKQTWAGLTSKDRATYRRLDDLFNQNDNYRHLREHMAAMKLPSIPYLGLYLSDLTYINVAHPSQGELEPQTRMDKINNVLRIITNYQQSVYSFQRVDYIHSYLISQQYIEELQKFLEDDNYKMSQVLEPDDPPCSSSGVPQLCSTPGSPTRAGPDGCPGCGAGDRATGKWSPPRWGGGDCRMGCGEPRSQSEPTRHANKNPDSYSQQSAFFPNTRRPRLCTTSSVPLGVSSTTLIGSNLPEPLLKVTLPKRASPFLPLHPTPSSVSLSGSTQGHATISEAGCHRYQKHRSGLESCGASGLSASCSAGVHWKPSANLRGSSSSSFHLSPSSGRLMSTSSCVDDPLLPRLHLLDDSLLDSEVASQSSIGGRAYSRRGTDASELNFLAVVAAAACGSTGPTGHPSRGPSCSSMNGCSITVNPACSTTPGEPGPADLPPIPPSRGSNANSMLAAAVASGNQTQLSVNVEGMMETEINDTTVDGDTTAIEIKTDDGDITPVASTDKSSSLSRSVGCGSSLPNGRDLRLVCHGCLQRKTVMRRGGKTRFPLWHRYWMVLMETDDNAYIVYFEPNSFRASRREEFSTKHCKVQPLKGLLTLTKQNELSTPSDLSSFRLIDPVKAKTYKFRCLPSLPSDHSTSPYQSSNPLSSLSDNPNQCVFYDLFRWFSNINKVIRRLDQDPTPQDLIQLSDK